MYFSLLLGMTWFIGILFFLDDMNLQDNPPKDVPKIFKREIMNNIHAYGQNHAHNITVKSTLPYKAFDHKSSDPRKRRKPLQ